MILALSDQASSKASSADPTKRPTKRALQTLAKVTSTVLISMNVNKRLSFLPTCTLKFIYVIPMLIMFQVLECLRGTSPTSSTTDSPSRRDTPTDEIESKCLTFLFLFVCLFVLFSSLPVSFPMSFSVQEKLNLEAARQTAGQKVARSVVRESEKSFIASPLSPFCSGRFFS